MGKVIGFFAENQKRLLNRSNPSIFMPGFGGKAASIVSWGQDAVHSHAKQEGIRTQAAPGTTFQRSGKSILRPSLSVRTRSGFC